MAAPVNLFMSLTRQLSTNIGEKWLRHLTSQQLLSLQVITHNEGLLRLDVRYKGRMLEDLIAHIEGLLRLDVRYKGRTLEDLIAHNEGLLRLDVL